MKAYHYFEFVPGDWFAGKIQRCSQAAKGDYIDICALYWNKECVLPVEDVEIFDNYDELIKKKVIKVDGDFVSIDFLDEHKSKCLEISELNSKKGKISAEKRKQQRFNRGSTPVNRGSTPVEIGSTPVNRG
jgi:hypothetical protein